MTRKDILEAALKCVNGDRDEQYGKPEYSFDIVARLWTDYLEGKNAPQHFIVAKDVAAMLALLKIGRISTGASKDDNWIDLAGYAACGGEIDSNNNSNSIKSND